MFRVSLLALLGFTTFCHGIHHPGHQVGPQRYEIEEDPAKQAAPSYHRTILAPKQAYDQNQLNQYYQLQQLNQLNQLNQLQQNAAAANPQAHQYLAALQQFYAASKQPQQQYSAGQPAQSQYVPQAAPQQGYPPPLGVLYSAASDVSQFQYSGNGVNYSF